MSIIKKLTLKPEQKIDGEEELESSMSTDQITEYINTIEHEGVVDVEAYREWKKTLVHPILNEKRAYYSEETQEKFDLGRLQIDLERDIQHLSEKEKTKILQLKKIYSKVMGRSNTYKRHAFKTDAHGIHGKLSSILDGRKDELIELFGRMFTTEEVLSIINKEWKMKCSIETLLHFKRLNAQQISVKIDEFKKSFGDIRLYNKTSRLEELTWLYGNVKRKYEQSKARDDYQLLLKTLEQLRKESEGEQFTINGSLDLKIENNLQKHIQSEIFKTLLLKEIILGRIAARTNVHPSILMKNLNESYYSKFTKFLDSEAIDADFDTVHPSTLSYDFEKIEKFQKEKTEEKQEIVEELKKKEIVTDKASMLKSLLKTKITESIADNTKKTLDMSIDSEIMDSKKRKKAKK